MANYGLRLVVEKIDLENKNEILSRDELSTITIKSPTTILELGLRHGEQIDLLQTLQDKVLSEQSVYMKTTLEICPDCGSKLYARGYHSSKFHSVPSHYINPREKVNLVINSLHGLVKSKKVLVFDMI